MSKPVQLHGYKESFASKSEAIRFLLLEGVHSKERILEKLSCTHQHIYIEAKKLGLIKKRF